MSRFSIFSPLILHLIFIELNFNSIIELNLVESKFNQLNFNPIQLHLNSIQFNSIQFSSVKLHAMSFNIIIRISALHMKKILKKEFKKKIHRVNQTHFACALIFFL